jgi:hypothetical protein
MTISSTSNSSTAKPFNSTARIRRQPSNATLRAQKPDSLHFGNGDDPTTSDKSLWEKAKDTAGLKHMIAGTQEGVRRLYRSHWKRDIAASAGLFLFTLPLALVIPGSHFVLIPGYIAAARAWHGTRGFLHGLRHPDDVLKPKPQAA